MSPGRRCASRDAFEDNRSKGQKAPGQRTLTRAPIRACGRMRQIELTIDDPKVYTRPFTVNLTQSLEADTELVDEFCLEGEKDYERLQRSRGK